MNNDLADYAVKQALKLGARYAEARLISASSNSFVLKNGIPELSDFDNSTGIGIRVLADKMLSFISTNELEKSRIDSLIKKTVMMQKKSSDIVKDATDMTKEDVAKTRYEVKQKKNFLDMGPEEKIGYLLEIEKGIKATKINVPSRYFLLYDRIEEKYYTNSEGSEITSVIPRVGVSYYVTINENNESAQRYWQYCSPKGWEATKEWNLHEKLVMEIKALRENMLKGVKPPQGKVDVVVEPEVTGIMVHESVGHPYEADRIFGREGAQAGESFMTLDMKGDMIGSSVVNVVDDPAVEGAAGFYLYDDEGVKARRKFLIKDGKINEFLTNRETAVVPGEKSNGSARACAFNREPIVRMSNTFMLAGDHTTEELIEGVKNGVYIKNFMEWNIDDKRVHQKYVGNEAYLIKNGRIVAPAKRPVIEISTFDLYKKVDAMSKKIELHAASCGKGEPMQAIPVSMGGPAVRLRDVNLGVGKSGN